MDRVIYGESGGLAIQNQLLAVSRPNKALQPISPCGLLRKPQGETAELSTLAGRDMNRFKGLALLILLSTWAPAPVFAHGGEIFVAISALFLIGAAAAVVVVSILMMERSKVLGLSILVAGVLVLTVVFRNGGLKLLYDTAKWIDPRPYESIAMQWRHHDPTQAGKEALEYLAGDISAAKTQDEKLTILLAYGCVLRGPSVLGVLVAGKSGDTKFFKWVELVGSEKSGYKVVDQGNMDVPQEFVEKKISVSRIVPGVAS